MENTDLEKTQREADLDDGLSVPQNKMSRSCIPTEVATAFCAETSLHGVKYIGQRNRHFLERIFWIVGIVASLCLAAYLIHFVFEKYQKSPVIITFQSDEINTEKIPFPAVTICGMHQFSKSKILELEEIVEAEMNDTDSEKYDLAKQKVELVKNICLNQHYSSLRTLPLFGSVDQFSVGETYKIPLTAGCVFNMLPMPLLIKNSDIPKNGTTEHYLFKSWRKWNYSERLVLPTGKHYYGYPVNQERIGRMYGLNLLIDSKAEEESYCQTLDSEGFLYSIHSPLELANPRAFPSVGSPGNNIFVKVNPDMITAHYDIINIEQNKRKCYFGTEKKLNFFLPYTAKNCLDDCLAILQMKNCNCTYFDLPRDEGGRICNFLSDADFNCLINSKIYFHDTNFKKHCRHCYSLCETIEYKYQASASLLRNTSDFWENRNGSKQWSEQASLMHVFMESETIIPKLRTRLYGWTDLVANSGGILGLCLGLSVLSLLEIVYFGTIRTFFKYCKKGRKPEENNIGWHGKVAKMICFFEGQQNKLSQVKPSVAETVEGYQEKN